MFDFLFVKLLARYYGETLPFGNASFSKDLAAACGICVERVWNMCGTCVEHVRSLKLLWVFPWVFDFSTIFARIHRIGLGGSV